MENKDFVAERTFLTKENKMFFQKWCEGGNTGSRSRSKDWILENLVNEHGKIKYPYEIETAHTWLDSNYVGYKIWSGNYYVVLESLEKALETMVFVEEQLQKGVVVEDAWKNL